MSELIIREKIKNGVIKTSSGAGGFLAGGGTGAAIGTAIMPGAGTAIGYLIGTACGTAGGYKVGDEISKAVEL